MERKVIYFFTNFFVLKTFYWQMYKWMGNILCPSNLELNLVLLSERILDSNLKKSTFLLIPNHLGTVALKKNFFYMLFHIHFHDGLSQDIEYSSLCYIVEPCCLSILYLVACIC